MRSRCRREVIELHRFFQDWFNATLPDDDASFARVTDALADGFQIVTPEGYAIEREPLLSGLREAHGKWRAVGSDGGRIWIENPSVRWIEDSLALLTYEEWQEAVEPARGRLSTVLFRRRQDAPGGVEWLHVHEVWLG